MEIKIIHESSKVYEFLKNKIRYNYIYQFNNLSTEEWKNVICYGLFVDSELKEIAMLNINYDVPVLLAASFENEEYNIELIKKIKKFLPFKFYTHIDRTTLENVFSKSELSEPHEYMNMGLCNQNILDRKCENGTKRIGFNEISNIKELIQLSYPEAWIDDDLIRLNKNFGVFVDSKLISFAGIHAYSEEYEVAAIAHVTTHPDFRRKGYAEKVVGALAKDLMYNIKFIGLNVKVDNLPAIHCYKNNGFKEFGKFVACEITNII